MKHSESHLNQIRLPQKGFRKEFLGKGMITTSTFYLTLHMIAKKGAIHHYKLRIPQYCERFGLSKRCFEQNLSKCIKAGMVNISGDHIYVQSKYKVIASRGLWDDPKNDKGKIKKNKQHKINFNNYHQLKHLLQTKTLEVYQNKIEYKANQAEQRYKKQHSKGSAVSGFLESSSAFNFGWSRISIANSLGYSSAHTGTRKIRKAVSFGQCSDKWRRHSVLLTQCSRQRFIKYHQSNPKSVLIIKHNEELGTVVSHYANIVTFNHAKQWNQQSAK